MALQETKSRARYWKARGQATIEFALIAIVLTVLLFGILEVSRLVFINSEIENAAREGAKYAALHDVDNGALANIVRSKLALADRNIVSVVGPTYCDGDGNCDVSVSRGPFRQVYVSVSYGWTTLVQILGLGSITLQSSSMQFVEVP